ncbi:DUF5993 family protein [Nocardia crassostreae]|uniref:DUF5993 family protein n=1 Tax=Nocardia crassostreae TaxID=53428 RepID=UPI000B1C3226|nr:DUF5993 family protein [Nocardia crassostreae]
MDTLILAGLLCVVYLIYKPSPRRTILWGWWIAFFAVCALLKYHITSGLGLGLTW